MGVWARPVRGCVFEGGACDGDGEEGGSVTFTITNGLGGKPRPSATIHGVQADAMGRVVVPFPTAGYQTFKAKESGAVRSQLVKITVTS